MPKKEINKWVECPICGKAFTRQGLKIHFRVHDEDYKDYRDEIKEPDWTQKTLHAAEE